ncbi:MAG: heavy-metal-associated domain-containing protein [Bacillota bacterium]
MYMFRVEKMSCGGCAGRVTKAIRQVDSAAQVDVDLQSKQVRVTSAADAPVLAAAIARAGYPAQIAAAGNAEK